MVTILITAAFRMAVLIRGDALINEEALISIWAPNRAELIRGRRLFEARSLLEVMR